MSLETPTRGEQRWFLGLTLSLVASLIAVAWITRQPLCIESEVLRRLEWRAGAGSFDLHRCRARQHLSYKDQIADLLPSLNQRLQSLQLMGQFYLGDAWDKKSFVLRVASDGARPDAELATLSDHVLISASELRKPGILEARILALALRESLVQSDGPSAQLLENFFLDMTGYRENTEVDGEVLEASDWKLTLYGEAVRRARQLLPVGEQRNAFNEWKNILSEKNAKPWALPVGVQALMHESLAAFGYRQDLRLFQIPYAVMWPDRSVELQEKDIARIHRLMSAVILPEQIWFPFSKRAFSRVNSAPVQVGRLVLFQCGLPRLDELQKLGVEFEHLLFVQNCEPPDVDLVVSALRDPRSFAKDYPEVDFAHIHWPSLRLALQRSGVQEISLTALFRPETLESFKKIGFLSEIDQDPVTGIRSWKGALEPFPMFRFKPTIPRHN